MAEEGTTGLFHFSGHGLRSGRKGWALVPSDVGKDGLWNAVTLAEVRVLLDEIAPRRDLTVLLDACADDDLDLAALLPDDAVLYLGTKKTPELNLGGTRHGALSWAVSTVLERWTWEQQGPSAPRAAIGAAGLLEAQAPMTPEWASSMSARRVRPSISGIVNQGRPSSSVPISMMPTTAG